MAYSAEITPENPTCLVFLLGQSQSMAEPFEGDQTIRKIDVVMDAMNRTLQELVVRCAKAEQVTNYYYISIIRYGGGVEPAFSGALSGRVMAPISEIAEHPAQTERRTWIVADAVSGAGTQEVHFPMPMWVNPRPRGEAHMCEALALVKVTLERWLSHHRTSFPPTVLHLTDSEPSDGEPAQLGNDITTLATADGPVLLFNCHISSRRSGAKLEYPTDDSTLPSDFARTLFRMSSHLPGVFQEAAMKKGLNVPTGARGFVFNGDPASVYHFFALGTTLLNLR
ncbi:MAG: VWA domain-containing protein [Planctomycetes bacterium]|nr:VWA domain-containing protein [Planctomycetota bacterium]